jgi:DNA polymerase-3 subunit epsilon
MDLAHSNLAFVDVETNGGWGEGGRIIELGVVRVEDNRVVKTMRSLVDPGTWLPPWITRLTGIEAAELEAAPTFRQLADELQEILDGCVFMAHNAQFDYGFVRRELASVSAQFQASVVCTAQLSRFLFPQFSGHSLDSVIERHQIPVASRHRAYDDAWALWELYKIALREFDFDHLNAAVELQHKKRRIYDRGAR